VLLSLVLFFCDHRFNYLDTIRHKLSPAIIPIQHLINWPIETIQTLSQNFADKRAILKENERAQEELMSLNVKLQRIDFLEHENSKLRSLLNHSKQIQNKILPAKLSTPAASNFGQQIIINKGKQDKAYIGQPILDAHGLLGQIISVDKQTSKALLITNRKSAVPVMVVRNGLQTIAMGAGGDYLHLANVPETADVRTGDFIVTSNLGEHFPAGYHVGTVKEVKKALGERFMQVSVVPKANINEILHVLLVWNNSDEGIKQELIYNQQIF